MLAIIIHAETDICFIVGRRTRWSKEENKDMYNSRAYCEDTQKILSLQSGDLNAVCKNRVHLGMSPKIYFSHLPALNVEGSNEPLAEICCKMKNMIQKSIRLSFLPKLI